VKVSLSGSRTSETRFDSGNFWRISRPLRF